MKQKNKPQPAVQKQPKTSPNKWQPVQHPQKSPQNPQNPQNPEKKW